MEKTESKTHNYIIKYCNTLRYCIDIIACAKYRDTEQNRFFPPPLFSAALFVSETVTAPIDIYTYMFLSIRPSTEWPSIRAERLIAFAI